MQIHEIIRTRRTALGLTQEQLAGKLGVSAPAVNKWERGNSYPDITLLPVLARTLRVDLNTLLSFREDLTETEIAAFLNRLYEVSRTEGCGAAFSLAEEKLRQFPNSDALAYSAAGLLEGLLTLFPGTDETARPGREDFVAGLYEQAAQSADPKIREWATYTVASRVRPGPRHPDHAAVPDRDGPGRGGPAASPGLLRRRPAGGRGPGPERLRSAVRPLPAGGGGAGRPGGAGPAGPAAA